MSTYTVMPTGTRLPGQPDRRPMVPIGERARRDTFRAPVARPGADTRPENWAAVSVDGLWTFDRLDEPGTPWRARFAPTGQHVDGFGTLAAARREAGPKGSLLLRFRRAAYTAAYLSTVAADRELGQRLLAAHMLVIGQADGEHRCRCGGIIAAVSADGTKTAHLDACTGCWEYGTGYRSDVEPSCGPVAHSWCGRTDQSHALCGPVTHRFCGDPAPVVCAHGCGDPAAPTDGAGCGRGDDVDCCRGCCW